MVELYRYMKKCLCVNCIQAATVRHEMLLLSNMLQLDDSLWEQRVRCGQSHSVCIIRLQADMPTLLHTY